MRSSEHPNRLVLYCGGLLCVLALAAGCSSQRSATYTRASTEVPDPVMWDQEGLDVQLRTLIRNHDVSADMTTPWRLPYYALPARLTVPEEEGPLSPASLLLEFMEEFGFFDGLGTDVWEITQRILYDDDKHATGVVQRWGFLDDSVVGSDLLIKMKYSNNRWVIVEVKQRAHCYRGLTPEGLCI